MAIKKILIISLLLSAAFSSSRSQESEVKSTMTYIKYRLEGPGLNEITSQSKEMWRLGKHEMRSLDPADTSKKIQPLLIFNPPDFWLINTYDSSGTHGINNDPTKRSYAPIFSFKKSRFFMDFQFGFEMEYVKKREIEPTSGKDPNTEVYSFIIEGSPISITFDKKTQKPLLVTAVFDSTSFKVIYEDYQTGLKPDSTLFLPPDTSKITESK